ncbi:MAG: NADP-reducing hydrogenase, subunit B [Thermotoga sp. 50_1627]|uniref:(2Fe-2S) ferredoxin domain-containing protein n=1 Tax=Pseudothermotoga sp. TaxID=2033661 RepID=UPI00076DD83C|nr:MAG: NADP-reducing hydrogenase, subunit B [Thermotoga sp. 50_64]KUK24671.1 MAG: NADP-reducing hydrogenase, subunit B [Thermotoga sp. 50_1627]MBC7115822.1 (2Fe-2S) ferredoxin domain-containing protein [Pseudothermotoga sp.]MDK2923533.1 NADP-reducing hydrogenase subunit HndB [Pseudothermotoga sp.]HBT38913.1 2Fe-2S ferredoxin [Pseudothermotoga sp.]
MSKVKSIEDLMKIKEKALKELQLRDTGKRGKITVAMGTCGIAAGAKETLKAVVEALAENNINDIAVVQSGCMGLCEVEPTIEVRLEGQEPVVYGHVTPENAKRIVKLHILGNQIVSDLLVRKGEM